MVTKKTAGQSNCLYCSKPLSAPVQKRHAFCNPECRFWSKVDKTDADGCWPWTACVIQSKGIGQFDIENGKSSVPANKFAYILAGLEIPDGFRLDPSCGNMRCVNPQHQSFAVSRSPIASTYAPVDSDHERASKIATVWIRRRWLGGSGSKC